MNSIFCEKNPVSSGNWEVDHLRKQKDGIWKSQLSLKERYIFDRIAGETLLELGYIDSRKWWMENSYHQWYPLVWKAQSKIKQ